MVLPSAPRTDYSPRVDLPGPTQGRFSKVLQVQAPGRQISIPLVADCGNCHTTLPTYSSRLSQDLRHSGFRLLSI
jgi:hypothetical protein